MTLPFEILRLICTYMNNAELLQCQLTSNQWHEASLEPLYSRVAISTLEKSSQYIQSISKSPELGGYLRHLYLAPVEMIHQEKRALLLLIVAKCPNILHITNKPNELTLWRDILSLAKFGQLSHLQRLPLPETQKDFKSYMLTALIIKESITTLTFNYSYKDYYKNMDSTISKIYQKLCNSISDFPNLKELTLSYMSNYLLSHYDKLIDDCKHLKILKLYTDKFDNLVETEHKQIIQPHRGIHSFSINWEILNSENELSYVMQKFPNLRLLDINYVIENHNLLEDHKMTCAITDFIRYIIDLRKYKVFIPMKPADLAYAFANVKKLKDCHVNVITIPMYSSEFIATSIYLTGKSLIINLPENQTQDFFFSSLSLELGEAIQSLDLSCAKIENSMRGFNFVSDLMQLCPNLEELVLPDLIDQNSMYYSGFQHFALKILTLNDKIPNSDISFLQEISKNCPNLKQLRIQYIGISNEESPVSKICMPFSNLDSITWSERILPTPIINYGFEVYIKLKTCNRLEFYHAIKCNKLALIDEDIYTQALNSPRIDSAREIVKMYFDITCQSLKEISVPMLKVAVDHFTWVF